MGFFLAGIGRIKKVPAIIGENCFLRISQREIQVLIEIIIVCV